MENTNAVKQLIDEISKIIIDIKLKNNLSKEEKTNVRN